MKAKGKTGVYELRELLTEGLKVFFDLDQGMLVGGVHRLILNSIRLSNIVPI